MDISMLVALLTPFLPSLLKIGQAGAEEFAKGAGGAMGEGAQKLAVKLWAKLRPAVESNARAKEAAVELAQAPEDEDYKATFRVALKKLLADDEVLAKELQVMLDQAQKEGTVNMTLTGDRSVQFGPGATGNTAATGDTTYNLNK